MENNVHIRVVRALKIVMFAVFGLNLVRIAYGGSKEMREDSFDFGEPGIEGVGDAE